MPAASTVLLTVSNALGGSTTAVHLKSIRQNILGGSVSSEVITQTSLSTSSLTSDVVTSLATMDSTTATATINNLTSSISCH